MQASAQTLPIFAEIVKHFGRKFYTNSYLKQNSKLRLTKLFLDFRCVVIVANKRINSVYGM